MRGENEIEQGDAQWSIDRVETDNGPNLWDQALALTTLSRAKSFG